MLTLIVACFSTAILLQKSVSLTETASASAILRDLSSQSGVNLEAGRTKTNEILIVSFSNQPLSDVMTQIAWSTFGKWTKTGQGFRLESDSGQEAKVERAYRDSIEKEAAHAIALFRSSVLDPKKSEEQVSQATRINVGTPYQRQATAPSARLLADLLGMVTPDELVNMETDDWYTVASNPTPLEHGFGPGCKEAIRKYVVESGLVKVGEVVPELQAVLQGNSAPTYCGGQLVLYYPDGTKLWEDRPSFGDYPDQSFLNRMPQELVKAIPSDMAVPLSDATKLFISPESSAKGFRLDDKDRRDLKPAIDRLRDPVRYEPLGTFMTDLLVASAKLTHRNLIADIDDVNIAPLFRGGAPLIKNSLELLVDQNLEMLPNWLAVRPNLPHPIRGHQVNRAALLKYIQNPGAWGTLDHLQHTAEFLANSQFSPSYYTFHFNRYLTMATADRALGVFDQEFCGLARLYNALPADLRARWVSGEPVAISELSDSAQQTVRSWLIAKRIRVDNNAIQTLFDLPTKEFAYGIPVSGWLRAAARDEDGFAYRQSYHTETGMAMTEGWAYDYEVREMTDSRYNKEPNFFEIQPGRRKQIRLTLELAGLKNAPVTTIFESEKIDPKKFVPWPKFDPAIRSEIEKALFPSQKGGG